MTGYRGRDDSGRLADPLTPESLRPLLWEAPASVLVERVMEPPDRALAQRSAAGGWSLEVHAGSDAAVLTQLPNTDAAFDALRSWAAGDGWWLEAFSWRPVGTDPTAAT